MEAANGAARERFEWPVRVYHEDTDGLGVVYHTGYLRFMERARTEWLRASGIEQAPLLAEHRVQFVVSRIEVEYLAPARYGDLLDVGVDIGALGRASLRLAQSVHRAPGECLCRAAVRIACVDADSLAPTAIPPHILSELKR